MKIEEIYQTLTKDIKDSQIYINEPMSKHTSFKIGGPADIYVKAKTIEDIKYIIDFVKTKEIPLTVIGNGSNLLVRDRGIRGITMQIDLQEINVEDTKVTAGAGVKLGVLAITILKNELTGFEFAAGIPGSIGGAVRMNAGSYGGEFKDIVQEVTAITLDGEIKTYTIEELDFSYRHSRFSASNEIILSATLNLEKGNADEIKSKMDELLTARKTKQPLELPSAGSTFKRGSDFYASRIIEEAGLKGMVHGGAMISDKHANFVVNYKKASAEDVNVDNATAKDVLDLTDYMKKVVFEKFGKKLELEVEIVGE